MSTAFILYGNSSAGKGTVGKKIQFVASHDYTTDLRVIETGEYFRAHPELCKQAHKGELVENHIVVEFFKQRITEFNAGDVVIDSPRTDDQVALLFEMLLEEGYEHIYAIYVDTSERNCRVRMQERASKHHRLDDKDFEAIEKRLSAFRQNWPFVVAALQKYAGKKYFHINGDQDIVGMEREAKIIAEEAFGEPTKVLGEKHKKKKKSHKRRRH